MLRKKEEIIFVSILRHYFIHFLIIKVNNLLIGKIFKDFIGEIHRSYKGTLKYSLNLTLEYISFNEGQKIELLNEDVINTFLTGYFTSNGLHFFRKTRFKS